MEKLTKKEVIEILLGAGLVDTKKGGADVLDTVDAVYEAIAKALKVNQKAPIGKYTVVEKTHKEAHEGRNIQTGETITIAAKDVLNIKKTGSFKKLA